MVQVVGIIRNYQPLQKRVEETLQDHAPESQTYRLDHAILYSRATFLALLLSLGMTLVQFFDLIDREETYVVISVLVNDDYVNLFATTILFFLLLWALLFVPFFNLVWIGYQERKLRQLTGSEGDLSLTWALRLGLLLLTILILFNIWSLAR